ncbi:MAG: ffh, partial [Steroidobacteraceae bacterium]|nr:ffh [Steroidobacteraceae bacterium]
MFDTLAARLGQAVNSLRGRGRLSEDNIADTLRQVRMALLEADVAVPVVKAFIDAARARAIGTDLAGEPRELRHGGRPVDIRARQQRPLAVLL